MSLEAVSKLRGGKLPACRSFDAMGNCGLSGADAGSVGHENLVLKLLLAILAATSGGRQRRCSGKPANDQSLRPMRRTERVRGCCAKTCGGPADRISWR